MFTHTGKRGQALIIIVFAIIGLIAIVALAIDGGNVFLNRRSAQNAADNAALAAALAKANNAIITEDALKLVALAITRLPAYNFADSTVTLHNPPQTGCGGSTNAYINDDQYIQVIMNTTVNTYFAPIVGFPTLSNCVEAISHVKPGVPVSLCYGALICGLDLGPPTDNGKNALQASGNASMTLIGAGAFSNSNHSTQALYVQEIENLQITPPYTNKNRVMVVGGFNVPAGYTPAPYPMPQIPYPLPLVMMPKQKYVWTPSDCDFNVDDLPSGLSNPPYMPDGVYCVSGDMKNEAYRNGPIGGTGIGGVTIVMLHQGISWTGNTDIKLNAPPDCSPTPCNNPPTAGLLLYLPYGNPNNVHFGGTGYLEMTGTILAPEIGSIVQFVGTYDNAVFFSQMIGWNFVFGGGADCTVNMPPYIYEWPGNPSVELVK